MESRHALEGKTGYRTMGDREVKFLRSSSAEFTRPHLQFVCTETMTHQQPVVIASACTQRCYGASAREESVRIFFY